jgi:transposase
MARGDLTDAAWTKIQPLLPDNAGKRGGRFKDHRQVLNGILWVIRTGAPWRDIPERYGPYQTCYDRFLRWQKNGVWQQILTAMQQQGDSATRSPGESVGLIDWESAAIDSTSVKVHPDAAGARHAPAKKGGRVCKRANAVLVRRHVIPRKRVWAEAVAG